MGVCVLLSSRLVSVWERQRYLLLGLVVSSLINWIVWIGEETFGRRWCNSRWDTMKERKSHSALFVFDLLVTLLFLCSSALNGRLFWCLLCVVWKHCSSLRNSFFLLLRCLVFCFLSMQWLVRVSRGSSRLRKVMHAFRSDRVAITLDRIWRSHEKQ